MKKYVNEVKIKDKKVILRVDYNVPIENGVIKNTKKIDATFETIDYLISQNCKIILLSHMGKITDENSKTLFSLKPVFEYIKKLNKYNILFCDEPSSPMLDNICKNLQSRQVVLVENTRFMDLPNNLESSCNQKYAMYLASLGEYYVNDAFASMHRNHASVTGIPRYIPACFGLLVKKELENLKVLRDNIRRPFVVIMGGAKLDDKIELMHSLLTKADRVLIGGGIANAFLKALDFDIGATSVSDESVINAVKLLEQYSNKIVVPKDVIASPSYLENEYVMKSVKDVVVDDVLGDIGYEAINNYTRFIKEAKTIFINGTMGIYEQKEFSDGTRLILEEVAKNTDAIRIVGGGDAGAALKKFNLEKKMSFISTGGGATLKYIADGTLPGIDIILKNIEFRTRKRVFVNLKDWLNLEENKKYANEIKDVSAVFFPSSPYLYLYNGLDIGVQDLDSNISGAHTGMISLEHLKDFGVKWCLLNHRELKEDKESLIQKAKILLSNDINAILCLDEIDDSTLPIIDELFSNVNKKVYVAFEPVTELSITEISQKIEILKNYIKTKFPNFGILYGSNVKKENIKELDEKLKIDGFLISREALDIESLKYIVNVLDN